MSILAYFIFIFYFVFFSSCFYYYHVQKNSGLSIQIIILLFALKVTAGCANLYIHNHEYVNNDIRFYFEQSVRDLHGLQVHPASFLKEWLFNWGNFSGHYNFLHKSNMAYWSDLGFQIHSKFMTLATIFTFGNIYANVIFFNLIYFLGLLKLYKVFYQIQSHKKWLFVLALFCIPSVLFWCSGIHKDGWILASIGFICYYTHRFFTVKKNTYLFSIVFFFFLLFVLRYYICLAFLIPYLLWVFFHLHQKRVAIFILSFVTSFFIFFLAGEVGPIKPLEVIVSKQQAYFSNKGYSDISTPVLEPNFSSFLHNFPSACDHIFLQPYFSLQSSTKYMMAAIDTLLILGMIITFGLFMKRRNMHELFFLMLLFFSLSIYLFIGYVIPNCGALVRYKSEFTALLLASLVALSEVPFLKRFYVQ